MSRTTLGIDIGGTSIKFGVVDDGGSIIEQMSLPTDVEAGPARVLDRVAEGAQILTGRHAIAAIGLGVPGVINDRGQISYPPNFPGWGVVSVAEELRHRLGTDLPIAVENDANVAALAEAQIGSGRHYPNFLFITLGTGVGGCIIHNGEIWRGADGGAGEVGHISVDVNGPLCNCGSRGCVEAYLGLHYMTANAAVQLERHADSQLHGMIAEGRALEPKLLDEAARNGDVFARAFLAEMGRILGAALASALNLCGMNLVIVGGGMSRAEEFLLAPALASIKRRALKSIAAHANLRPATLYNDAGVVGAALLGAGATRVEQPGTA